MNSMNANEVVRKLDTVINQHKSDVRTPFDTDWVGILKFLQDYILEQDRKISELEGYLQSWQEYDKVMAEKEKNGEIDLSFGDVLANIN